MFYYDFCHLFSSFWVWGIDLGHGYWGGLFRIYGSLRYTGLTRWTANLCSFYYYILSLICFNSNFCLLSSSYLAWMMLFRLVISSIISYFVHVSPCIQGWPKISRTDGLCPGVRANMLYISSLKSSEKKLSPLGLFLQTSFQKRSALLQANNLYKLSVFSAVVKGLCAATSINRITPVENTSTEVPSYGCFRWISGAM